jgi:hypothetical protein
LSHLLTVIWAVEKDANNKETNKLALNKLLTWGIIWSDGLGMVNSFIAYSLIGSDRRER